MPALETTPDASAIRQAQGRVRLGALTVVRAPIRVLVLTVALGPATTKPQRGRKPLLSPFPPPEHATGAATPQCDRDVSTWRACARRDARRPVPSTVGGA